MFGIFLAIFIIPYMFAIFILVVCVAAINILQTTVIKSKEWL